MNSLLNLGIPDLPIRAFQPTMGRIKPQGGGKGGSAPDTPDYVGAAKETAKGNLEATKWATQANRPTQITPWGTVSWDSGSSFNQDAYNSALDTYQQQLDAYNQRLSQAAQNGTGVSALKGQKPEAPNAKDFYNQGNDWTQTIELNPQMQAILDQQLKLQEGLFGAQNSAADRVNQTMGQGFDISQLPEAGSVYDPTLQTNNATDLLMQRLNPELDRQQERLRAQLANQGITQGSEAYNNAMRQFTQQRNDAANQAALAGIGLGMQQQGLQFNQSNQNRQQGLAEQSWLRSLPLNELNALRTGNQVQMPNFPGFNQQATSGGPDILGATQAQYGADLGNYNAQQAQAQGLMSGLGNIGGGIGSYIGGPIGGLVGSIGGTALGGLLK